MQLPNTDDELLDAIKRFTRPDAMVAVDTPTTQLLCILLSCCEGTIKRLRESPVHVGDPIVFEGFRLHPYGATPAPNRPVRQ